MTLTDTYVIYRIIKLLSTPWIEQDAYKYGIIDARGNVLKRSIGLHSAEEKNSYSLLHRFVFNLKRMIETLPGGASKIGTYSAALYLLREEFELDELFELNMLEDGIGGGAPANNVGGGHIAGLGVGPQGEPPAPLKKKKKKFLPKLGQYGY